MVDRSMSQSLFNIYYLGQTRVDRRCNASMMPWIIEELKLKAGEMKFIWLSPGECGRCEAPFLGVVKVWT